MAQLKDKPLGEVLYIPRNVLRAQSDMLLDDTTPQQISETLQVPIDIVESDGHDFVRKIVDHI